MDTLGQKNIKAANRPAKENITVSLHPVDSAPLICLLRELLCRQARRMKIN